MTSFYANKKITFFSAETIPSFAGSAMHVFRVAEYLSGLNANCQIVSYNYNKKLPEKNSVNKVEIYRMTYFNKNLLLKILSAPNLIRHYFSKVLRADVVIIYGRYLIGYPIIILFGLLFNKKIVFQSTLLGCDDMESIKKHSGILWPVYRFLFAKIDCYWSINKSFSEKWLNTINRVSSLANVTQGVCIERFYPKTRTKLNGYFTNAKDEKTLQILSCGILIERKGYREVFQALSESKIPFVYTIIGQFEPHTAHRSSASEKKEMASLKKLGERLLGSKINFIGNTQDILGYYHKSDLLIHPATREGTPNVILESMAAGLPVVCRKLQGLSGDFLLNKNNFFEYTSKEGLINAIDSIRKNLDQTNNVTLEAINTIRDKHSFEKVMLKIAKCLLQKKK